jgi:Cu/Ag efflux protein CusF
MTSNAILIAVSIFGAGLAFHVGAEADHKHLAQNSAKPGAAASAALTEGEVRKVDKGAGKVTIKHGPMPKFDMPPMTMAYPVTDKAMLDQLKPGDKIKFDVDGTGGKFTVTRLEKLK